MEVNHPPVDPEIEKALANRDYFNALVYTPWEEAVKQLSERQADKRLAEYIENALPQGIPEGMRNKQTAVLFRHIATSSYEIRRFMIAADALTQLSPLILEYTDDKFNDWNEAKYFLGKLCFHKGMNTKKEPIWESVRVINFNESNNKPISSLQTVWGESFVDLHHDLFRKNFPNYAQNMFDISSWLRESGSSAKEYYKPFLSLFLQRGILFENFLLEKNEFGFTRSVILPALLEVTKESGLKPLIVALEPTEIEGDQFWYSHPVKDKQWIDEKMARPAAII